MSNVKNQNFFIQIEKKKIISKEIHSEIWKIKLYTVIRNDLHTCTCIVDGLMDSCLCPEAYSGQEHNKDKWILTLLCTRLTCWARFLMC